MRSQTAETITNPTEQQIVEEARYFSKRNMTHRVKPTKKNGIISHIQSTHREEKHTDHLSSILIFNGNILKKKQRTKNQLHTK